MTCKLEKHNKIKCTVSFPKSGIRRDTLAAIITRGGRIVALGHARLSHGNATFTLAELRSWKRGSWQITLVVGASAKSAATQTLTVRIR